VADERISRAWIDPDRFGRHGSAVRIAAIPALAVATSALTVLAIAHPAPVLGGLLALGVASAVWARWEVALVFLLLVLPFNYGLVASVTHGGTSIGRLADWKDAMVVLLFVRGLFADQARGRWPRLPEGALPRYLIAYVLFYTVLTFASPHLEPAVYAVSRDIEGPLLFLAIVWLRPSRTVLKACLFATVVAAAVMAGAAVYEHFGPKGGFQTWYGAPAPQPGSSFFGASGQYRAGAFFDSPLTLAFYLTVGIPVALGCAFAFRRWRLLALLAAGLCVAGILVSGTRSGYIGGAVGAVIVLGYALSNWRLRIALVGVFAIAVGVAYFYNQNNPELIRSGESQAKHSSITTAFDFIAAHPFGAGLGTIDQVGQRFSSLTGSNISSESTELAKGYEGGIAALLLYPATMLLLMLYLLRIRRAALARGDPVQVPLAAGAAAASCAVLAAGLFLGVQDLAVEVAVWGPAALAASWALPPSRSPAAGPIV
jgi:hypothetical protein